MAYVDLPAHGLTVNNDNEFIEVVGGAEALATEDTSAYVRMSTDQGYVLQMYNGGNPGFGYAYDLGLPAGATVADISIVVYGYAETSAAYDPAWLYQEESADTTPTVNYDYQNAPYLGNVELGTGGYAWGSSPLPSSQWFRLLDETLPAGQVRLSPAFIAGPTQAWFYAPGYWLRMAYLAARITYTTGALRQTPLRVVQRGNDGLSLSGGRRAVQGRTIQASNRVSGIR